MWLSCCLRDKQNMQHLRNDNSKVKSYVACSHGSEKWVKKYDVGEDECVRYRFCYISNCPPEHRPLDSDGWKRDDHGSGSDWLVMSRNGKLVALLCLSTSSMTLQSSWLFSSTLPYRPSQAIRNIFGEGWMNAQDDNVLPSFSHSPFSFLCILGSETVDSQKYACNIVCLRAFFSRGVA